MGGSRNGECKGIVWKWEAIGVECGGRRSGRGASGRQPPRPALHWPQPRGEGPGSLLQVADYTIPQGLLILCRERAEPRAGTLGHAAEEAETPGGRIPDLSSALRQLRLGRGDAWYHGLQAHTSQSARARPSGVSW